MRHPILASLCLCGIALVSACNKHPDVKSALKDVNVIDESNLNDVMLSATDSLTLPHRPNLGSWRYRLAVTQDAATLLAHASI